MSLPEPPPHKARPTLEARFVDLQKRLRGAVVCPRPVFGLADHVREALGRDPLRAGHAMAAASWLGAPDANERLATKLREDLLDLAALKAKVLEAPPTAVPAPAPAPAPIAETALESPWT